MSVHFCIWFVGFGKHRYGYCTDIMYMIKYLVWGFMWCYIAGLKGFHRLMFVNMYFVFTRKYGLYYLQRYSLYAPLNILGLCSVCEISEMYLTKQQEEQILWSEPSVLDNSGQIQ